MNLKDLADYEGAKRILEKALKIDEKAYGPDHPNVARDVNNIGLVLQAQGDLQEARKRFERALKIGEKAYGPDHPNVAAMANNLGTVLQYQGDLKEARKCYERAYPSPKITNMVWPFYQYLDHPTNKSTFGSRKLFGQPSFRC